LTVSALEFDTTGLDYTASAAYLGFAISGHTVARATLIGPTPRQPPDRGRPGAPRFQRRYDMTATRILALHGYHGSAAILRRQISPVASVLPGGTELVFVDAPSLSRGDFGWWHDGFRGWERTRDWVLDLTSSEHFDGVLGFSQGAALTGLLAALQDSDPSTSLRFEFAVMVGGFTSDKPQHSALFQRKITLPSLHVMGASDSIVPMRDSARLADRFENPVIVEHRGGHVIPSDPAIASRIARFVADGGVVTVPAGGHRA
jgi:pimeloyl-ACP methyl ester carboxylesterase